MKKTMFAMLAATAMAAGASAQQGPVTVVGQKVTPEQTPHVSTYTFERKVATDQAPQVLLDKIQLNDAQVFVETRTTPNAPYSGETTNESVQQLPDGNRIVHRSVTRVYRDSAGRTRRETLDNDNQVISVAVNDPTTGVSFVADPRTNKVSRSTVVKYSTVVPHEAGAVTSVQGTGGNAVFVTTDDKAHAEGEIKARMKVLVDSAAGAAGGGGAVWLSNGVALTKGETTKEDLGQQTIEGVVANGTRTTTVIPAGAIGNEAPIKVVSEEWFSPELQVLMLTKHSDPRSGEATYRLTGVSRTEPAKALFEPPAGVVVK